MNDISNMTTLSRYMYRAATSRKLSLKGAIAQLQNDAYIRSTRDILMKFSGLAPHEEDKLQGYICDALSETSAELSRDSLRRKVSIWIKDNGAISKSAAIQLAFAFKLSFDEADELLKYTCSEGFHLRDPEDIVWAYALLNRLSFGEACTLQTNMRELGLLDTSDVSPADSGLLLTNQLSGQAMQLTCEDDLIQFLRAEHNNLGSLHNTAYYNFTKYMDILQNPEVDPLYTQASSGDDWSTLCQSDTYSVREILTEYLHNTHIPRETRSSKKTDPKSELILSAMQKNIRSHWPDEITLSKMKSRLADVSRKVLILLFVAVDGYENTEYDEFEEELSPEEQFEDTYQRLNHMLSSCGFAPLDSRIPFDWMIMFCICSGNKDFVDARIERFLKEVFLNPQP